MSLGLKLLASTEMKPPVGIHSYWSAPKHGHPLEFTELELLCTVAAPTFWRAYCGEEFVLFTDDVGYDHINRLGIVGLYDHILPLHCEEIDTLPPEVFWCASKIQAMQQAVQFYTLVPFVHIDFDAYVRWPFWTAWRGQWIADVMPCNVEPATWECYRDNQKRFEKFFPKDRWDWSLPPYCAGILGIFDPAFASVYYRESLAFMQQWAASGEEPKPYVDYNHPGGSCFFEEQVFADQRMLAFIANRYKFSLRPIGGFDDELQHLATNKHVVHLHTDKALLRKNDDMRRIWRHGLIQELRETGDDRCWNTLQYLGLTR